MSLKKALTIKDAIDDIDNRALVTIIENGNCIIHGFADELLKNPKMEEYLDREIKDISSKFHGGCAQGILILELMLTI